MCLLMSYKKGFLQMEEKKIEDYNWEIFHFKNENREDVFISLFMDNNYIARIREETEIDPRIVNIARHVNVLL